MSTSTGVTALDHTIQEANIWLKAIDEQLALEDRHQAYSALRAVLHALRDRLPPEVAVKLGAQLPIMVRGIYYEGWHMAATPTKERHLEEFAAHIVRELPPHFPINPLTAARGVYEVLWEKLDPGEFGKLMAHLPTSLRNLQG
ncbi:hypothetical protein XH98_14000 [Bradyrhizobium sp. CCBAU 51745]|nr:hypothetical protein [Bradyrhizobium sp. CCBAU 51745]